jgi:hypothetical protein
MRRALACGWPAQESRAAPSSARLTSLDIARHATILRLVGLDFEKLAYRFNGRDMRLTDVHGHLIPEILA